MWHSIQADIIQLREDASEDDASEDASEERRDPGVGGATLVPAGIGGGALLACDFRSLRQECARALEQASHKLVALPLGGGLPVHRWLAQERLPSSD